MAVSRVYSTRFLMGNAWTGWITYTVPAGKRAVVKCVSIAEQAGSGAAIVVAAAGIPFFGANIPSGYQQNVWTGMVVAYAGETIGAYSFAAQLSCHVSGYLFDDP